MLRKSELLSFVDMERERTINLINNHFPSVTIKDRVKKFVGLPKSIHGEYVDNEQCAWRTLKKINAKD